MALTTRFRPTATSLEGRTVPAFLRAIPDNAVVSAPDDGGVPVVKVIDPTTGEDVAEIQVYDLGFTGGVRAALGDVTGDGVKDLVTAAGPGGGPHVKVYDGATGAELRSFFAYDPGFRAGITVAVGDVNRDGFDDIVTGAGPGGGPHVQAFDGRTGQVIRTFFAYDPAFRGGVNVASGDVNRDGFDDLIVGAASGGGPHVQVFDAVSGRSVRSFFAFDPGFRGGVNVGGGDLDGDGFDDILVGAGPGGAPHVRGISGRTGAELASVIADDAGFRGGVRVSGDDANRDGTDDLVAHTRHGADDASAVFTAAGANLATFVRRVDDHPSARDLIEGSGENRGIVTVGGGSGGGGSGGSGAVTRFEGAVTSVNAAARTFTIRRGGADVPVRLSAAAKVERNDVETTLTAFRAGDFAEARLGADGLAFKVEASGS